MQLAKGMLNLSVSPGKLMSFHPSYNSRNISPMLFDPEAECPRNGKSSTPIKIIGSPCFGDN